MHGYEIIEQIFERTHGLWRPGPAAVYPALYWLEEKKYIKPVSSQDENLKTRKPYEITERGIEALKDYEKFRSDWEQSVVELKQLWW